MLKSHLTSGKMRKDAQVHTQKPGTSMPSAGKARKCAHCERVEYGPVVQGVLGGAGLLVSKEDTVAFQVLSGHLERS